MPPYLWEHQRSHIMVMFHMYEVSEKSLNVFTSAESAGKIATAILWMFGLG